MVQGEPQLNTGIRRRNLDLAPKRELDCLFDARMYVEVKYAPNLVGGPAAPFSLVAEFPATRVYSPLNKRHRRAAELVDDKDHMLASRPPEMLQVVLLGSSPLDEREQAQRL
jgi:hypothetical protein